MKSEIKILARKYEGKMIEYRHHFHMFPELSSKEFRTSEYIEKELETLGYETQSHIAGTGVTGFMKCGNGGSRTIALRADMDALPIKENTCLPFSSRNEGVMHACGHDAHSAILLGVANIIAELKEKFNGSVKLIFQPAEEFGAGGRQMVDAGVIKDVDFIAGLHTWGKIKTGQVGIIPGYISGGCETVKINIKGQSAHTSIPECGVDAMYIAAKVIDSLYAIKSLNANAYDAFTFTLTMINGGSALNVLCDNVSIQGLLRYSSIESRENLNKYIEHVVKKTSEAHGGVGDAEFIYGYIPMKNSEHMTPFVKKVVENVVGTDNTVSPSRDSIGLILEDFAYYQREIPGVFLFLGCANDEKYGAPHTSTFNIDEKCISIGAEIMTNIVVDFFKNE